MSTGYNWTFNKKRGLLSKSFSQEEKSSSEVIRRNATENHSKQHKQVKKSNRLHFDNDDVDDEKVPLPSIFIGLPSKSPPLRSGKHAANRNDFVKKKSYESSEGEVESYRSKLVNDILKKMEYSPKRQRKELETPGLPLSLDQDDNSKRNGEYVHGKISVDKFKARDSFKAKFNSGRICDIPVAESPKVAEMIQQHTPLTLKSSNFDSSKKLLTENNSNDNIIGHKFTGNVQPTPHKDSPKYSRDGKRIENNGSYLDSSSIASNGIKNGIQRHDKFTSPRYLNLAGISRCAKSPTYYSPKIPKSVTETPVKELNFSMDIFNNTETPNEILEDKRKRGPANMEERQIQNGSVKREARGPNATLSSGGYDFGRFSRIYEDSVSREESTNTPTKLQNDYDELSFNGRASADVSRRLSRYLAHNHGRNQENSASDAQSINEINRLIPLPLRRSLSIGLYAVQVADRQNLQDDSKKYTETIAQARAFRQWCVMFRLRQMIKNEEQMKLDRAHEHWKLKQLKRTFNVMRSVQQDKDIMAKDFHETRTVGKAFNAFVPVTVSRKQLLREHLEKRRGKALATAWLKWTTAVQMVTKDRMKTLFTKWKEKHLTVKRELLLEKSTERQATATFYYKWKMTYTLEQQDSISSLHFKIVLLSKCWQFWKVHTAERRVKQRMTNVARIHYEQRSLSSTFIQWKQAVYNGSKLTQQLDKRLVTKVFYAWKSWAAYSKFGARTEAVKCVQRISQQKHNSRNNESLENATESKKYLEMYQRETIKESIPTVELAIEEENFAQETLQSSRKKALQPLCMARQSRCFASWLDYARHMKERRDKFQKIIMSLKLKALFLKWKEYAKESRQLGQCAMDIDQLQSRRILQTGFNRWKNALEINYFTRSTAEARTLRAVRRAAMRWRNKVKKKHLNERLVHATPTFMHLTLKASFKRWIYEKRQVEKGKQRALVVASLLKRGQLSRAFSAWRIVTQEDRIIHHMVARKQRRDLAWVFDSWRLVLTRKKVSRQYRYINEIGRLQKVFSKWRAKAQSIQRERNENQSMINAILAKSISNWKGYIAELKRRRLDLARRCFLQWRRKVTEVADMKENERGMEARIHLLLKLKFKIWLEQTSHLREKRLTTEKAAELFRVNKLKRKMMKSWRRQFQVHCIFYEYQDEKRLDRLETAFDAWKNFIKEQLQDAVERFTDRLEREASPRGILRQHTLSESYGSGSFPPLRSSSGYFGSLPNMVQPLSPLPISPLVTSNSLERRRGSPASLSPEHALLFKPHSESEYCSIPGANDSKSFIRSKSLNERPRSPLSLRSTGSLSSKERTPVTVPPLFTDVSRLQDEEYADSIRPKTLSLDRSETPRRNMTKEKSLDDDTPPFPFGHNSDEDAMSFYSFQSESIGVNREIFMSSTIRHWRQLPLSRTFKAWLKFTQQQRIRRELHEYFLAYKRSFALKSIFCAWHRKLYCRLVAVKFLKARILRKYFNAISDHCKKQKATKDKNLIAELHLKNTRLATKFKIWRKGFLAKRRLQSLVGRWQEAVHISGSQRSACNRIIKQRESKLLKDAFRSWKDRLHKTHVAKEFEDQMLLKRTVGKWHRTASKLGCLRNNYNTTIKRRQNKVFIKWRLCLEAKAVAKEHFQDVQQERLKKVLLSWLSWTKRKKSLSQSAIKFQRKLNFKMAVQAFFIWSEEAARLRMADDHHRESLMIRALESWHGLSEQRSDLRTRLYDFQRYTIRNKARNVFDWWKKSAICSKVFKEKQNIQHAELLKDAFARWSGSIRQKKWELHLRMTVERKAFNCWLKRSIHMKKRRTLAKIAAKKWISRTKVCIELQETADDWLRRRSTTQLRSLFLEWREAANGQKIACFHYEYRLVVTTIREWSNVVKNNKNLRKAQRSVEEIVEYNIMSSAFETWSVLFKRFRRNAMVLDNYTQLRRQEHLKIVFDRIHLNALDGRAKRYKDFRLQRTAFNYWKNLTKQCKTLAFVKERLMSITLLKIVKHWRQITKDHLAKERLAKSVAGKKHIKQMKKTFAFWLRKTRGRLLARTCFEGHLVKRTFDSWRQSTRAKGDRKSTLKEYKKRKENVKLTATFRFWKRAASESRKTKKLDEIHMQIAMAHHRDKLLDKCFYSWRNENIVEKLRKKQTSTALQKYFTAWKQYEQKLLEKTWKQWRVLRIKRQVMKAMEMHETKKLLSEVFSSWYNYTYIRRGAVHEIDFRKKRKIFRKWMQEYNKA
eukprot:gene14872-16418_t